MLPSCHHSIFNVLEDGSFTAQEEVRIADKIFVSDDIKG
jgi:hypothetical protein